MFHIINSKLGESRGKPRIWIEGEILSPVFNYGDSLCLEIDSKEKFRALYPSKTPNTKLSVSKRVNPKTKKIKPLITADAINATRNGKIFSDILFKNWEYSLLV